MKKILLTMTLVLMALLLIGCGSSSGSTSKNTCGYCGATYAAGDAGGNYRCIARTNLCKSCYEFYETYR